MNYPGEFRETIENDVKTQVAQREFTYVGEDGQLHTVEGISELVQSAEGLRSEVWRRQPSGSVIANGTFAQGLDAWAVSGVNKVVVKAHGASKRKSICASILQARKLAKSGVVEKIRASVQATEDPSAADEQ